MSHLILLVFLSLDRQYQYNQQVSGGCNDAGGITSLRILGCIQEQEPPVHFLVNLPLELMSRPPGALMGCCLISIFKKNPPNIKV